MKELLERLHRLKLVLASLTLTVLGVLLIALGQQLEESSREGWFAATPWSELGGILVGAGLLTIWLDRFFRREQDAMADQRFRQILRDQAPIMRDAVLDGFAANREDLRRVATPETLDDIITNSLALRLGDDQFAA